MENHKPAIECANGDKRWYVEGKLHRVGNKPAIEYSNGDKYWYVEGKLQPCPVYLNPKKDKKTIKDFLKNVPKEDGKFVFYKGTLAHGGSPISKPQCGCPDVFDYQVGYTYEEPHVDHDFNNMCGAGINICSTAISAKLYGSRVVKVLVRGEDVIYTSNDKCRVKRVEVVEVVSMAFTGSL